MVPVAVTRASAPYRAGLASALRLGGFEPVEPDDLQTWAEGIDRAAVLVVIEEDRDWSTLEELASAKPTVVALIPDHGIYAYLRALVAGARGVVNADTSPELIVHVLQAAIAGETVLPIEAARQLANLARKEPLSPSPLTPEEVALLRQLAEGLPLKEMADSLHVSDRTLRRRLQSLYLKLGAANRSQAIVQATRLGLID